MRVDEIHVRVITPVITRGFRSAESLTALESPGVKVTGVQIETGPGSIESEFESAFAVPGTVAKAIEAERDGVDAVVIDCMHDPGLAAVREALSIPVIGPCQAAMLTAAMLGHKFSIVSTLLRVRAGFEDHAALIGLSGKLASVRSVDIPVLELEANHERTVAQLAVEAEKAVENDGADAIILGCTGLLGCAAILRERLLARGLDALVIDPIPNAVMQAVSLARLGLSQSGLAYPHPPAKELVGFAGIELGRAKARR